MNLTQPALLCFGNKVPTEVDQYHIYLKVLAYNQAYKQVSSEVISLLNDQGITAGMSPVVF